MAQQSARRGRDNQGFPPCLEHALGDMDQARELPYRPAADQRRITGRTDGSIRLRATAILKFSLATKGASTDAKTSFSVTPTWPADARTRPCQHSRPEARQDGGLPSCRF